jgi:hypothetical protein
MNFMLKQTNDSFSAVAINHRITVSAVQNLPDRCAQNVTDLAGADWCR